MPGDMYSNLAELLGVERQEAKNIAFKMMYGDADAIKRFEECGGIVTRIQDETIIDFTKLPVAPGLNPVLELWQNQLRDITSRVHAANKTWWHDPATGQPLKRNVGEMLMLIVSEVAEAMEGHRKSLPDDKLPHRKMVEVELADAIIRIFDVAGGLGLDLGGAFAEKMAYNAVRADHKPAARLGEHGKKY